MSSRSRLIILGVIILPLITANVLLAQSVIVDDIILQGNKKTQASTINFENSIKRGDTFPIESLDKEVEDSRLQLLSSGLFNDIEAIVDYNNDSTKVVITYDITENWYLFPAPIFELADRNFNVWWQDFDRDLRRTIYGGRIAHYNTTGRRDRLRFIAHTGYTRKLEMTYDIPNIIGESWGLGFNLFYSDRREVNYQTEFNKPLFFQAEDERRLLQRYRAGIKLINRPNTFVDHQLRLEYHDSQVDDAVVDLNADYFPAGASRLQYFLFDYDFVVDKTNYNFYPTEGYKLRLNVNKEGLFILNEIDNTFITASAKYYHPITSNLTATTQWEGKTNLSRKRQAYTRNRGLGWTDFLVTGYDLFVIDGPDYAIVKNYVTWKFLDISFDTFDFIPRQFRRVPILAFLRMNFDLAYVNEPTFINTNALNNTLIYGFGPAIDIIVYNNYLFAIEYGITRDLDTGLYLKTAISF